MNSGSMQPGGGLGPTIPVDMKDPRIRITVPDVLMRLANDGPMYAMIILAGILAAHKITSGFESLVGGMFALQARSRPPENEKAGGGRNLLGIGILLVYFGAVTSLSACH